MPLFSILAVSFVFSLGEFLHDLHRRGPSHGARSLSKLFRGYQITQVIYNRNHYIPYFRRSTTTRSLEERISAAKQLESLENDLPGTLLVDNIQDEASRAYGAYPDRLYIIQKGVVKYHGGIGPYGYHVRTWKKRTFCNNDFAIFHYLTLDCIRFFECHFCALLCCCFPSRLAKWKSGSQNLAKL